MLAAGLRVPTVDLGSLWSLVGAISDARWRISEHAHVRVQYSYMHLPRTLPVTLVPDDHPRLARQSRLVLCPPVEALDTKTGPVHPQPEQAVLFPRPLISLRPCQGNLLDWPTPAAVYLRNYAECGRECGPSKLSFAPPATICGAFIHADASMCLP